MITPYESNKFTYYFVSKVISYVTRYFTIKQPNQLSKKVTHTLFSQLPKLIPLYWSNNFVLMATNLKTCLSKAAPSAAH